MINMRNVYDDHKCVCIYNVNMHLGRIYVSHKVLKMHEIRDPAAVLIIIA